jgi:hypothetical protein
MLDEGKDVGSPSRQNIIAKLGVVLFGSPLFFIVVVLDGGVDWYESVRTSIFIGTYTRLFYYR